ncbi:MAG: hypothetical protein DMG13_22315 [Acidobacteria bacterium]|nr:MAG: hypothetical protein DMG13_22315 [Acidobacteriota bacterium]
MVPTPEVQLKPESVTKEPESLQSVESGLAVPTSEDAVDENLYLTGRPKLKDFLRYVRHHAVNPLDDGVLTDEWENARTLVRRIEKEEAGIADNPPIRKMGTEYEPLLIEFLKDPLVQHSFNTVPTEVAFVELDRLVVYQKHIDLTFVRQLERKLGPRPTEEQIFRTCLPFDHPQPPVKWSRMRRNSYVFMSPSNDLRFLGAIPMKPENIKVSAHPGNLVGVVGLAVGFGTNFMNAIYAEKRLILNNGSHRAYALRKMGITHVPCIIQHLSSLDQLDVIAASEVGENPDFFLKHPRPPMLKDYFNPGLHKVMPVHRRLRQVTVRFEVEENFVPAM